MATLTGRESEQVDAANSSGRTPVVFIHGLWLLASSWDRWATLFEQAGFAPVAPGWPDDPETVEEARAHARGLRREEGRSGRRPRWRRDRKAEQEAGRRWSLVRRAAGADRRRTRAVCGHRCDRS